MGARYERSLFFSDLHIPYQNKEAVAALLKFTEWFKPSFIFIVGDLIDFYSISHFLKDPTREQTIQDDLDEAHSFLSDLRKAAPESKIVFFEGNHEARLTKYVWTNAKALAPLRNMKLEELLGLSKLGIEFKGQLEEFFFHGFAIEHGFNAKKFSSYTAKGQIDEKGCSGLSGHTHRMGVYFKTDTNGDHVWFEDGCLCERRPEYIKSPNWQNGFCVGYFKKTNHRFHVEPVIFTGGKAVYAGREFA